MPLCGVGSSRSCEQVLRAPALPPSCLCGIASSGTLTTVALFALERPVTVYTTESSLKLQPGPSPRPLLVCRQTPAWLEQMIAHTTWRDLFYKLAEAHPDCLMLNFTVKVGVPSRARRKCVRARVTRGWVGWRFSSERSYLLFLVKAFVVAL